MTANQYTFYNGALPTTAPLVAVTTGTTIKTLLQVATPATLEIEVISWGISFNGGTFGNKVQVELLETDVAATVTTGSGHIIRTSSPAQVASQCTVGTTATGYTATGEGTIAATRLFDVQYIDNTSAYSYTWSLGNYPRVSVSKFLRVRVLAATTAVNAITWVTWDE